MNDDCFWRCMPLKEQWNAILLYLCHTSRSPNLGVMAAGSRAARNVTSILRSFFLPFVFFLFASSSSLLAFIASDYFWPFHRSRRQTRHL